MTVEKLTYMVRDVLYQWCYPELLKTYYYSGKYTPIISFEVGYKEDKRIFIRMTVTYGPFGEVSHTDVRFYNSIMNIEAEQITNQLLHILTFDHSPFYYYKTGFRKRMEVAG